MGLENGERGGKSTHAAPQWGRGRAGDSDPCSPPRMQHRSFLLLVLLTLLALTSAVAKKKGDEGFGGLKEGWRPATSGLVGRLGSEVRTPGRGPPVSLSMPRVLSSVPRAF